MTNKCLLKKLFVFGFCKTIILFIYKSWRQDMLVSVFLFLFVIDDKMVKRIK